jgi:hypothetical protein
VSVRNLRRLVAGLVLALGTGGTAQAQEKLIIAIYAPTAPFDSGDARFQYVSRLAQHIGSVAGQPAEGKAYNKLGDFEAAVKRGDIHFAIVDSLLAADANYPRVIANATAGGKTSQQWALFASASSGASRASDLSGKRLAYVAAGRRDVQFIENALLDGVINVSKFFSGKPQSAPDVASAVQAVTLGKADAVCVPVTKAKGLRKVYDAGQVPLPAFVQAKNGLPEATISTVTRAVVSYSAGGALDGWRAGGNEAYRSLAGQMSPKQKKPVMADPDLVKISSGEALLFEAPNPAQVDISRYFLAPKIEGP